MNTQTHYRIPLFERFIEMNFFGGRCTCLHIDEVGVFIYHDSTQALTRDNIRHHLTRRRRIHCVVEAESVEMAIQKFYDEWDGANIGGKHEHAKALWIDRVQDDGTPSHKLIEELPPCSLRHRNRANAITCGTPVHDIPNHPEKDDEHWNSNGEFGMCGLEGYDYPESECPMIDYFHFDDNHPIRTATVNGLEFRYTSWKDAEESVRLKKEKEVEEKRRMRIQKTRIYKRLMMVEL